MPCARLRVLLLLWVLLHGILRGCVRWLTLVVGLLRSRVLLPCRSLRVLLLRMPRSAVLAVAGSLRTISPLHLWSVQALRITRLWMIARLRVLRWAIGRVRTHNHAFHENAVATWITARVT